MGAVVVYGVAGEATDAHSRASHVLLFAHYGFARFRAVMLTSLTTFAGLTPLILEKATQAQFLIPMAVSLGFGILFATAITLLLVPINYLLLEDLRQIFRPTSTQPAASAGEAPNA